MIGDSCLHCKMSFYAQWCVLQGEMTAGLLAGLREDRLLLGEEQCVNFLSVSKVRYASYAAIVGIENHQL